MKLSELKILSETPQLKNEIADPVELNWKDTDFDYVSGKSIERRYDILIKQEYHRAKINNRLVIPALLRTRSMATIFIQDNKGPDKDHSYRILTKILFYHRSPLSNIPSNLKNPLQIQRMYTDEDFETQGMASYLLATLTRFGNTIISDEIEYLGGKELWKKMAKAAQLKDYRIRIFNTEDQSYLSNEAGDIIEYNGENIDESIIWKEGSIGKKMLLFLLE